MNKFDLIVIVRSRTPCSLTAAKIDLEVALVDPGPVGGMSEYRMHSF
jgi:hypothetical protein